MLKVVIQIVFHSICYGTGMDNYSVCVSLCVFVGLDLDLVWFGQICNMQGFVRVRALEDSGIFEDFRLWILQQVTSRSVVNTIKSFYYLHVR